MGTKSILGTILILIGIVGLIIGVFGLFGPDIAPRSPWIFAILGLIFFFAGISIMKSTGPKGA